MSTFAEIFNDDYANNAYRTLFDTVCSKSVRSPAVIKYANKFLRYLIRRRSLTPTPRQIVCLAWTTRRRGGISNYSVCIGLIKDSVTYPLDK